MQRKSLDEVLKEHTDSLMALPGVVGMGRGVSGGKPCIRVLVAKRTPALLDKIPSTIDGYPVVVDETGVIRKL